MDDYGTYTDARVERIIEIAHGLEDVTHPRLLAHARNLAAREAHALDLHDLSPIERKIQADRKAEQARTKT